MAIKRIHLILLITGCLLINWVSQSYGYELKTKYTTIVFNSREDLDEFNDNIYIGRKLGFLLKQKRIVTLEDEVRAKVDILIKKVCDVLDMYPANLNFTLRLFADTKGTQAAYRKYYGRNATYIAFYSMGRKTMYIAVNKVSLRVFAHETGHVVVDHYFKVRPPYKIHEVLAQYSEKHITD